jgi:hypothetical protein
VQFDHVSVPDLPLRASQGVRPLPSPDTRSRHVGRLGWLQYCRMPRKGSGPLNVFGRRSRQWLPRWQRAGHCRHLATRRRATNGCRWRNWAAPAIGAVQCDLQINSGCGTAGSWWPHLEEASRAEGARSEQPCSAVHHWPSPLTDDKLICACILLIDLSFSPDSETLCTQYSVIHYMYVRDLKTSKILLSTTP